MLKFKVIHKKFSFHCNIVTINHSFTTAHDNSVTARAIVA